MKKLDSRYIVGVFLLLFVLRGILEFIWKGNYSFTLDEIYFGVPIVVGVVIGLDWYQFIKAGVHLNLFFSSF